MANTFTIKRGSGIPTAEVLANYELGYSTGYKTLYIKHNDNNILPIGSPYPELLYGGTGIPEAADLNTYTKLGNYFSPNSNRSATLINTEGQVPFTNSGFALKVKTVYGYFEKVTVFQEAYNYIGTKKYRHGAYSNVTQTYSWSVWKTYLNNESKFSLSSSQVTGTLQLANGGTGTVFTDMPVNAIIKASSETNEDGSPKKLWYTTTKSGAFYATAENGAPTFGTLPIPQGGTGLTASPSILINLGSTAAANVFQTTPRPGVTGTLPIGNGGTGLTASPSILVNLASTSAANVLQASPRPGVTGLLSLANGGTNNDLSTVASNEKNYNAIVRISSEGSKFSTTPVTKGAFYATAAAAAATLGFGTLPINCGGTNATTTAQAKKNLGIYTGTTTLSGSNSASVTFGVTFSSAPSVLAGYSTTGNNATGDWGSIKVAEITTTGCNIYQGGSATTTRRITWIAIGNLA